MPTNSFIDRISSLDSGYAPGQLSVYPAAYDTDDQLYIAKNESVTKLAQTLGYTSRFIVVEDVSVLPPMGLVKIGQEIIYYSVIFGNQLQGLKRGFAGSRQGQWNVGENVTIAVMAEHHNAIKDAILNLESTIGIQDNPNSASLNGILKSLENRFLAPKPIFMSYPLSGAPPLTVTFQNFSAGEPVRYFWDFGDGGTSVEAAPTHIYLSEGTYTVKLNMITTTGAQGVTTKTDYITVDSTIGPQFFYVDPLVGTTSTNFLFVDQTTGDIASRNWVFDDGNRVQIDDPDIHTVNHVYTQSGTYNPALLIIFRSGKLIRLTLPEFIIVN